MGWAAHLVVLDPMERHGVTVQIEEIRDGRLGIEPKLHVGDDACRVGAIAEPRVPALMEPLGPFDVEWVAIGRFAHRDDLQRRRTREYDARAATDEDGIALQRQAVMVVVLAAAAAVVKVAVAAAAAAVVVGGGGSGVYAPPRRAAGRSSARHAGRTCAAARVTAL